VQEQSHNGAEKGRIIVLGAGYAGLTCSLELQDHLPRGYELVLVTGDRYHWFTTELHEYAAGTTEESVRIPLKRLVAPPGRLIVDWVTAIDPEMQQVELKVSGRLDYSLLVFALGSEPEYFGLPGVAENALTLGNPKAAGKLREKVQSLVNSGRRSPHVVVVGGGLTGVEVAGELADEYQGQLRLTLIMAGFDPGLVQVARQVLELKGIRILTGNPIVSVDESLIHLKRGTRSATICWSGPAACGATPSWPSRGSRWAPAGGARSTPSCAPSPTIASTLWATPPHSPTRSPAGRCRRRDRRRSRWARRRGPTSCGDCRAGQSSPSPSGSGASSPPWAGTRGWARSARRASPASPP